MSVAAFFHRNAYFTNEVAQVSVSLDLSKCESSMEFLAVRLIQKVFGNSTRRNYDMQHVLAERRYVGFGDAKEIKEELLLPL